MKRFFASILLGLALVSAGAHAGILQSSKIDASTTNLTTSYTLAGARNITVSLGAAAGTLCWYNGTGAVLALYVDNDQSTTVPTADVQDVYLAPNLPGCLPQNTRLSRSIQVRSGSGTTVSTGILYLYITDRRG